MYDANALDFIATLLGELLVASIFSRASAELDEENTFSSAKKSFSPNGLGHWLKKIGYKKSYKDIKIKHE
jgi:hypothetical protein